MSLLVTGVGELLTNDPEHGVGAVGRRHDAALVIEDGRVVWVGDARRAPAADDFHDVEGRAVIPGLVDSHTHLVFAGDRADEFAARLEGRPYDGGGIWTTVAATRAASDDELRHATRERRHQLARSGVTYVEAKSGYGLSVSDEARLVELSGEVADEVTFLGAHVVPEEYRTRREEYVTLVSTEMLGRVPGAHWIDVFCDAGAFSVEEAREILLAGRAAGKGLRLHTNQLADLGGARLAAELAVASADHLTYVSDEDLGALGDAEVVATLLPGAEFSTRSPYPDARRFRERGVVVALATDCNPGTSYITSMTLVIALAVRECHMSVDEAIWSASAGGARALRRNDVGSLRVGSRADLAILDAPRVTHLAYRPGAPLVHALYRRGVREF
ncbi:MAG: imidazolonepropionase [Acidimicrobiaceae bacterium]|nr:imidazolonepropionase [Acidimicrobiaceae bacterium]